MVQTEVLIAFAIGQMLADAANQQLKTGMPEPNYRTLAFTDIFTGLFFAPISVYFLVDDFGWETTYMCDPDRIARFFMPIALLVVILAANLGFCDRVRLSRRSLMSLRRRIENEVGYSRS